MRPRVFLKAEARADICPPRTINRCPCRIAFALLTICWVTMSDAAAEAPPDTAASEPVEEITFQNASVRVVLKDSRITSLKDKIRSREHASPETDSSPGLFHIQFVKNTLPAGKVDATEMACRLVRRTDNELEIEFEHPLATALVRLGQGESPGESCWSISVQPKDPTLAIGRVAFPVFATPLTSNGQDKKYLSPLFEGRFLSLRQTSSNWRPYPSDVFAQMMACLSPDGGFLLWTDDGQGHVKALGFDRRERTAEFAVRHFLPVEPGGQWTSPYRVRLSFCDETWQDAADIYRDWATAQPWSNVALRDRTDVPELLRHPPLCISTQIDKENLDTLPDRLAAWQERFDAPIVYRPLGWEKHGNWVGIDYFPPSIGEARFRELAARLREQGIVIGGFISGYYWTTHREPGSPEQDRALADFFEQHDGLELCERTRTGELLASRREDRDCYRLCRGTPFGRGFLQQTARSLFDLGVTVIHDDQDHGPYPDGIRSCFDASHGHPIPCGPWSTAITRDALREIRAEAHRRGLKDFFITKESCSELFNLELHAYQARFFHEDSKPGLVPLAQYLYHEHIPVIFGWVTAKNRSPWELGATLVYGQIPSLAFWDAPADQPNAIPAESTRLLEDYYGAMKTYAKPHLLYGRMRHPLIPDAPTVQREIRQIGIRKLPAPKTIIVPSVIQSAWDDGHGNVGVFAVNTQDEPVVLKVQVPGEGRWQATSYTGAAKESEVEIVAIEKSPTPETSFDWTLPPLRLCGLIFNPSE